MRSFLHVSNTWLSGVVLFPFFFVARVYFLSGKADGDELIPLAVIGLIFSLPAFFLCLIAFHLIKLYLTNYILAFSAWLIAIPICIILNVVVISLLLDTERFLQTWEDLVMLFVSFASAIIPGLVAAWLSVIIRFNQFKKLFNNDYEADYNN